MGFYKGTIEVLYEAQPSNKFKQATQPRKIIHIEQKIIAEDDGAVFVAPVLTPHPGGPLMTPPFCFRAANRGLR